ncbi:MAG: FIST N-terminal domain-containing protein [Burkholderiaceae bacterium]|nr:FIST N-terminal domain-containing protein [Burkholderiaceae bacterium]
MNNQKIVGAMPVIIQDDGNWDSLRAAIAEIASTPGVKGIMALACESHGTVPDSFDAFLRNLSVPIFGGVFPGLIANSEHLEHGNIVLGLRSALDVYVVPSLSDAALDYDEWLAKAIPSNTMPEAKTMFVFVDGLAPRIGALIDSLFNTFGLQGNFIGGGAGSLITPNLRCLITAQGVIRDAAVLAIPKLYSQVSVAHGWLPIAGPFEVTGSENNVILTLDWEPALDVYRRALEVTAGFTFDFAAVAQAHPFGIARLNKEFVVRDPIAVRHDGGLICVGDVPRGSLVHIMNGNVNSLLAAAAQVRTIADANATAASPSSVDIAIDCISRTLFLGEKISSELYSLHHTACPLIGAFTLGEIANSGHEYLEFHNKTVVIATIWE